MESVDQIIIPRWLIPIDDAKSVLQDHALAITDERIVAVDTLESINARYQAKSTVNLSNHVLLPGFVNAHTHAAMTLLRGYADDLPLMEWLNNHIWPTEAKWVDAKFVEVGTDLALAEMIQSGTTCFNDMYFFPEVTAARAQSAGMRACVGMIVIDFPSAWAKNAEEYISKGLSLADEMRHSSLITTAFAPHAPYTVSDEPLTRIGTLAEEMDCRIHMHIHETKHEVEESLSQHTLRPLQRLEKLEILGPKLTAVHAVHLEPNEIKKLAELSVNVVHCPQSNLKLSSGFCPVTELMKSGVAVSIGTDGAASNNDLDMLAEMQSAALLAKGASGNPAALPAHDALEAATLGGARAIGLEEEIGSLIPNKKADIIAIDLSDYATQPVYNPISQLVYSATRSQVTDVWVNGKRLLENRQLTTLDGEEITRKASELANKIS